MKLICHVSITLPFPIYTPRQIQADRFCCGNTTDSMNDQKLTISIHSRGRARIPIIDHHLDACCDPSSSHARSLASPASLSLFALCTRPRPSLAVRPCLRYLTASLNGTLPSYTLVDCYVAACSADDPLAASFALGLNSLLSPASSVESGPSFASPTAAYTPRVSLRPGLGLRVGRRSNTEVTAARFLVSRLVGRRHRPMKRT